MGKNHKLRFRLRQGRGKESDWKRTKRDWEITFINVFSQCFKYARVSFTPRYSQRAERNRKKLDRIGEAIEDLIDSTLTPEEEELIKKHKEMIKKGDFSEFIDAEDLCIE